ncbi:MULTISPECIES: DUF5610 domain-containing protein [Shewanella]|uniref:DUF5610 domain-containing protein n=1 Tax=Shewanella marisflavi TaxID=260364 RepID=A0AAC9U2J3_9GAMM|nr:MULTISPECIES: DUF5610 domain-containing protein [Shewanella]ASJ97829.1 hypothetical protein CFF01_15220 [Shewanella marisflavi]MCL1040369.1 DUF5610 domain-containing protein [Shewanella marisflavi]QDF76394.1 hypothetical protein FGA12_15185 [Shewanella marisflavi]
MEIQNHGGAVSAAARNKTDSTTNHGQQVSEVAKNKTALAASKQLMNAAILSAQQEVNLSAGNEPMQLLYKAAIEAINEELAPTMGEHAIETAVAQGVDTSPEATADRIVSFATQFFAIHQEQNRGLSFDEQLNSFMDIIGGAIDQGFDEAKDILSGLKVLEGDIADGVDKTYSLVQEGLQAFRDSFNDDTAQE